LTADKAKKSEPEWVQISDITMANTWGTNRATCSYLEVSATQRPSRNKTKQKVPTFYGTPLQAGFYCVVSWVSSFSGKAMG